MVGYSKLTEVIFNPSMDGFYYKGIGVHNVNQSTELTKDSAPASLLGNGLSPKFAIIINDPSSDSMSVTFKSTEKTEIPTIPSGLKATSTLTNSIDLQWSASSHTQGIKEYQIFRDGKQVGTTQKKDYVNSNLASDTAYTYYVKAVSKTGEDSASSSTLNAKTQKVESHPEGIKEWDATAVYVKGDKVLYKGAVYTAKWWSRGEQPDKSGVWASN